MTKSQISTTKAIQDERASLTLEEVKTNNYSELGLECKCYQALQNKYLFKGNTTADNQKAELFNTKLPKGQTRPNAVPTAGQYPHHSGNIQAFSYLYCSRHHVHNNLSFD